MKPPGFTLKLLALLLFGPVLAAGRSEQFDVKADYSGAPNALTLSATIRPAASDLGQTGSYFVAAQLGSQLLLLQPTGWVPFDGRTIGAAASAPLALRSFPLLGGNDVSALECASVIAGYGKDAGDMLGNGLYRTIYQIPAQLPHASPLPCSAMADADVARFLEQASFGPTDASIADVKQRGMAGWIDYQMSLPKTGYTPAGGGDWPYVPESQAASCTSDGNSASPAS
ncbi:hypothetical protein, partial [Chitinimonas sp.]|uniref:hypothetical protein n=1 Tax=Chitinimonas sp. TaxID=1934313 RepID=UPI0035B1B7A2